MLICLGCEDPAGASSAGLYTVIVPALQNGKVLVTPVEATLTGARVSGGTVKARANGDLYAAAVAAYIGAGVSGAEVSGPTGGHSVAESALDLDGGGYIWAGGIAGSSLCPIAESVTELTIAIDGTRANGNIRNYAGGIAGVIGADSPLTKNGSTVTINAQSTKSIWVGGIAGLAPSTSPISKSYAHITMDIKNTALTGQGSVNLGGILGYGTARTNTDLDVRVIEQCYATGSITAVSGGASEGGYSIRAGGLVGAPGQVTIIDSYAMVNIDADASAGGQPGGCRRN